MLPAGYPIGHPLHGKIKPGSNRPTNQRARTINMAMGSVVASTSGKENIDEAAVFAKMDNL